jgi:hypothetical protein
MPRAATSTPPALGGLRGREQRLPVLLLEVGRLGPVAHVDRGQPAVARDAAAARERVGDLLDAVEAADAVERALDRPPRSGVGDLAPLDAEDERRVGARERGAVGLEQVDRLLGLGPRDREVVGGLAARAGRCAEQDEDEQRAGQAALPVLGEGTREAREEE